MHFLLQGGCVNDFCYGFALLEPLEPELFNEQTDGSLFDQALTSLLGKVVLLTPARAAGWDAIAYGRWTSRPVPGPSEAEFLSPSRAMPATIAWLSMPLAIRG